MEKEFKYPPGHNWEGLTPAEVNAGYDKNKLKGGNNKVEELPEQTVEEQEQAQANVIGRSVDEIPIVEGGASIDFTAYEGFRIPIASVIEVEAIDHYIGPLKEGKPSYVKESTKMMRQVVIETESFPVLDENKQITSEKLMVGAGDKRREWTCKLALNLTLKTNKETGKEEWTISKAPSANLWKMMRKLGADKPSDMKKKLVTITTVPDREEGSDMRWPVIVK